MTRSVGIYYDEAGIREIMTGAKIEALEKELMERKLSQISAEFVQRFGRQGSFAIKAEQTSGGRGGRRRLAYRIVATSRTTTALLKKEPGWLGKFLK